MFAPTSSKARALAAVLAILLPCAAALAGEVKTRTVVPHGRQSPTSTPTADLRWTPTPIGPMASPVSGEFSSSPHITYLKFPAGAKTPLHMHSGDYVGIVISGNTRHVVKGMPETERLLPPGSHWYMPGRLEHVSECMPGAECVIALIQDDKFDFLEAQKKN